MGARTPELRLVSVCFVDLVGFTSLSESRDAEDVRELLGRYFDSARTIVDRYGGVVEKFIGDAVMAVWGVPVAREDDAERAVRWHGLRGEIAAARASLDGAAAWASGDDLEVQAIHASLVITVNLAEGHAEKVIETGPELLKTAISTLGASNESVRYAWPDTLQAALSLERLDVARGLLALLSEQPPGRVPPYLEAQLVRGCGLVAAAEGRHDAVEADLTAAIERFRALGYPYWLAVAQTDLAGWLVEQGRGTEATQLLDEAVTALASLGAAPALARAQAVMGWPAAAVFP